MRILSWNLWNSFKKIENPLLVSFLEPKRRRESRYLHQLKLLREENFDICFFQEVNPLGVKKRDFRHILGYRVCTQMDQSGIRYKSFGIPLNFQNGLATLSRIKQKKIAGLKLSGSFGVNEDYYSLQFGEFRYALFSEVEWNDKRILLVNTHFHHGIEWTDDLRENLKHVSEHDYTLIESSIAEGTARKSQEVLALKNEIASRQKDYDVTILAGDFNFSTDAMPLKSFESDIGLKRLEHEGYTWDPITNSENYSFTRNLRPPVKQEVSEEALEVLRKHDGRQRTMDHIYVSKHVDVNKVEIFGTARSEDGYYPSDHFGIVGELAL